MVLVELPCGCERMPPLAEAGGMAARGAVEGSPPPLTPDAVRDLRRSPAERYRVQSLKARLETAALELPLRLLPR
jgi:hypothetical protein